MWEKPKKEGRDDNLKKKSGWGREVLTFSRCVRPADANTASSKHPHMIPHGHASNSYAEQYKRMRGVNTEDLAKQNLMTDRSAYLTFLETQLQRVSASCLTVVSFQDRMLDVESQTIDMEQRLSNGLRRLKLQLPSEEQVEEKTSELEAMQAMITTMGQRLENLENERKEDKLQLETMTRMQEQATTEAATQAAAQAAAHVESTSTALEMLRVSFEQRLQQVQDAAPSHEHIVSTLSQVLSTSMHDLLSTTVDPKLNDAIKFAEEAVQAVHDRLHPQIEQNAHTIKQLSERSIEKVTSDQAMLLKLTSQVDTMEQELLRGNVVFKKQQQQEPEKQQKEQKEQQQEETQQTRQTQETRQQEGGSVMEDESKMLGATKVTPTTPTTRTVYFPTLADGYYECDVQTSTTSVAPAAAAGRTSSRQSSQSSSNLELQTRMGQLERHVLRTQSQQENLSTVTAHAIDTVIKRIRSVEGVSNASKQASEKILNLIQQIRNEKYNDMEKIEIIRSTIKKIDKRMTTFECMQEGKEREKKIFLIFIELFFS